MDRLKKKKDKAGDWTAGGSFINKPTKGWLHPDEQLDPDAGVCYGLRYVGCLEVKESMRSLDFDTRTNIAKESISRVCDLAGLKTPTKKTKRSGKITRLLGDQPNMRFACENVNLTITIESLSLMSMDTGEVIANHLMPGISFASGGDAETMDFVSYVAKDGVNGRACFVLECGAGLAQDVITTIGQAFELRFKQFLAQKPQPTTIPERVIEVDNGDSWGDDNDYYNDRPGAVPPDAELDPYPTKDGPPVGDLIDLSVYDNHEGAVGGTDTVYDNPGKPMQHNFDSPFDNSIYDNKSGALGKPQLDAFDMKPFTSTLPEEGAAGPDSLLPFHEEWYHGKMSRPQAEELLVRDGDFMVRESPSAPGQYVLSGNNGGHIKHLLLVDPEGVVRTKDRTFNSVSHLISFHRENGLPICSHDSEVVLKRPIIHSFS